MKATRTCPKCGCKKILHVVEVADKYDRSPTSNAVANIARTKMGGKIGGHAAGPLEAHVCSQCGYCELYVSDVASLVPDGDTIRELNG